VSSILEELVNGAPLARVLKPYRQSDNLGSVGAVPPGASLTTGATAATKGAWVEMIAASTFDSAWVEVYLFDIAAGGVASQAALDIGIGAAAAETVLIADLLAGYAGGGGSQSGGWKNWAFPLRIPTGSRLSARLASVRTATTEARAAIILFEGESIEPQETDRIVTTYGMGTVPNGTAITPGASGAEGAWTEIVSATTRAHFAFMPSFQITGDTALASRGFMVDIGIGAGGAEVEIGRWHYQSSDAEYMGGPLPNRPAIVHVPAGVRLAMRASSSGTLDTGYDACIHAI
jgi:hypothetical protein